MDYMILNGNLELRGLEKKTSSKGNEYLIFRLEDETGKPCEAIGRFPYDTSNLKKGVMYHFNFEASFGKYPKLEVISHELLGNK